MMKCQRRTKWCLYIPLLASLLMGRRLDNFDVALCDYSNAISIKRRMSDFDFLLLSRRHKLGFH